MVGEMSQADRIEKHAQTLQALRGQLLRDYADTNNEGPVSLSDALMIVDALLEVFGLVQQIGATAEQLQKHPLLGGLIRQFATQ